MENIYESRVIPFKYLPEFRAQNCRIFAALSYTGDLLEFLPCGDGYEIAVFEYKRTSHVDHAGRLPLHTININRKGNDNE